MYEIIRYENPLPITLVNRELTRWISVLESAITLKRGTNCSRPLRGVRRCPQKILRLPGTARTQKLKPRTGPNENPELTCTAQPFISPRLPCTLELEAVALESVRATLTVPPMQCSGTVDVLPSRASGCSSAPAPPTPSRLCSTPGSRDSELALTVSRPLHLLRPQTLF